MGCPTTLVVLDAALALEGDLPLVVKGKSAGLLGGLRFLPRLPPARLDNESSPPAGMEVGLLTLLHPGCFPEVAGAVLR